MKQNVVALELSHKYVKILVAHYLNEQLLVDYVKKVPVNHAIENGVIKDRTLLIKELSKNNPICDPEYHINQLIDNAILVLPPYGLEVYETKQITSVISPEKVIGELDIKNIFSIIRNKRLPVDNELIDIIPESFVLDSGDRYALPPIDKISSAIAAYAKVHTLPQRINSEYSGVLRSSNIQIARRVVSTYAEVEYLATNPQEIPENYFLLDIGASTTSLSLVGRKQLFATRSFSWGGDNITDSIVRNFNIAEKEAEKIKTLYGLDKRQMKFEYPVCEALVGEDKIRYTVNDLNVIIEKELVEFSKMLNVAVEQLVAAYKIGNYRSFPLIIVGGGSRLKGLKSFLQSTYSDMDIRLFAPKVIGARDPSLVALLGSIVINKKFPVARNENATPTVNVTRDE